MPQSLHRDLKVWQKAMDLVVAVYAITVQFPSAERFGLTSQMRRAAVSIPCNIAEGKGRMTAGPFSNHLSIARGSLNELETLTEIALRLELISGEQAAGVHTRSEEISKMLFRLARSLHRP